MKPNGRIQLYPLLRVALMLIVGIVVGDALCAVITPRVWMVTAISVLAVSLLLWRRPITQSTFILIIVMLMGAWCATSRLSRLDVQLPTGRVAYEAIVVERPQMGDKVVRVDLLIASGPLAGHKIRASVVRDDFSRADRIAVGDGMSVVSELRKPENFRSDANFNYVRWMMVHGFVASTYVRANDWSGCEVSLERLSRVERMSLGALRVRDRLLEHLYAGRTAGRSTEYAVVAAMTLGDRSALTDELEDVYSITGATHVLSLSGLHLSIIYAVLSLLLTYRRPNAVSQAVIVVTIWLYAFMVGLHPTVVRSAAMFSICSLVAMLNRDNMSLNTLAFAAIVMLVANPLDLWDVGFQMSFMAVLFIVVLYKPMFLSLSSCRLWKYRVFRWIWGMTSVSVTAQLGVTPLVAYYFGRFSCYFLLTNFVAVPLTTFIIYMTFVFFVLAPLPLLQELAARALIFIVTALNRSLEFIASLPGASVDGIRLNVLSVVLIYVIIACCCVLVRYAHRLYLSAPQTPK